VHCRLSSIIRRPHTWRCWRLRHEILWGNLRICPDLSSLVCPDGGEPRIFTRGNDDVGSSSVLYAYPRSDVVIVVLSHAGS
jgi:hypothetical protein